ncbi:MAG: efflux RND transporter periplasmic adaptor subunit [Minisyncoccia bacterium]
MKKFFKSKITIGIGIALVLAVGGFLLFHHSVKYQFVPVTSGPIIETVSLTGNTTPLSSVSLSFNASGIISNIYSALGDKVSSGQILAEENTSDLSAQLAQAQATVDAEQAKLQGLEDGSRPEDIASSQASLDKANQDLANMYGSIIDTSTDSYAKANDAVRTELSPFFSGGDTNNPTLIYATSDTQSEYAAETSRLASGSALAKWSAEIANVGQSNSGLENLLQDEISYLNTIRQLLNTVGDTLNNSPVLSVSTLAIYKADVTVALNEVNLATTNLNTISQNIASQKLTVEQFASDLALKKAGAAPSDIAAQAAAVAQAQASVKSAEAKLQNAEIVAPISGVITQFDAKVGQLATPGVALVSIISNNGYEVDAGVSETDIGKVALGDSVSMTLDAFPNETFAGKVFYIAPAETNQNGVITYQIKISFDQPDTRFKSGLTANIDIETKQKDNALVLPQYAILQNDQGAFVETVSGGKIIQNPVTIGIEDEKGNAEIISGVTAGEQVLNIGLKS